MIRGSKSLINKGKVVCLVSGGIDSHVAAWLIFMKGYVPMTMLCVVMSPIRCSTSPPNARLVAMAK